MTCLLCGGSFPMREILLDARDDGPDVGPVCVHCYSDLTAVATGRPFALQRLHANVRLPAKPPIKAELKTVVTPPLVRRRTPGPGLVGERGSRKAPEGNTYALRHGHAQPSAWGGPAAARAQRQQDPVTFEPTCLDDPADLFTEIEQVLGGDER